MHGSTGGSWKRSDLTTDTKKNDQPGNRPGHRGFVAYRQPTPPRQLPTLQGVIGVSSLKQRSRVSRIGVGNPTWHWRLKWTPTWTPSRLHSTSVSMTY
jgi:hypothetical protein